MIFVPQIPLKCPKFLRVQGPPMSRQVHGAWVHLTMKCNLYPFMLPGRVGEVRAPSAWGAVPGGGAAQPPDRDVKLC